MNVDTADPKKKRASHHENAPTKTLPAKDTKISRVWHALRSPGGLNRFQAEVIGEHCLNTTIAALRASGRVITDEWESVPTRFGCDVRVKRYRAAHG